MFEPHTPTDVLKDFGWDQSWFQFPNGYGASVVCSPYIQGYELAVLNPVGRVSRDTCIADDVLTGLTEADVVTTLDAIAALEQVSA